MTLPVSPTDNASKVPTLYEWLGGAEPFARFVQAFYQKVPGDPILAPVFAAVPAEHFPLIIQHVTMYMAEVLGGPTGYSGLHGGHSRMMQRHLGRNINEAQRKRWLALLLETADEQSLPDDPEFRSAFLAYFEWGSRHVVIDSSAPVDAPVKPVAMPSWNWGVPGGPASNIRE